MAVKRKSISKKTRFEVFKRDGFMCQYCGAHPPAVILEPDHIDPVANGGGNDMDNLVTSCFDCNRGKAARLLTDIPQNLKDKAAQITEREAQINGYQDVMAERRRRIEFESDQVCAIYEKFNPKFTLTDSALVSVKMFIEKLGKFEVMNAMERAYSRPSQGQGRQFKYFCGICWNKIKESK